MAIQLDDGHVPAHGDAVLPPGPIVSLVYRIAPERRGELLAFLAGARPLYERPGGIQVGLYESADEAGLFLELVTYAGEASRAADQERVDRDEQMMAMLRRFRAVVGGPVEVRRMKPVPVIGAAESDAVPVAPAAFNDHAAVSRLLAAASLPVPDEDDVPVRVLVARDDGRILGCAGWERHGSAALLRSIAVDPTARRRGVGAALVRAALTDIEAAGAGEVVLLTTGAAAFFATLGFAVVERAALPLEVRASRQVQSQCCASAVAMRRAFGGG